MENVSAMTEDDERMDLPAGFRFHPTDEELITCYLSPKVLDCSFSARAIGEVDLNKVEPWDLPWRAKMGEKEWYFFCIRDRKYPTGMRTNRATDAGYWKATGKDKEIFKAKTLVGMKKTLVFYKGRAPRGEKTNWVMHEYRLDGNNSVHAVSKSAKSEWVICRIFKKSSGGKKIHISGLTRTGKSCDNLGSSDLPPLTDLSSDEAQTRTPPVAEGSSKTSVFTPANSLLFPKVSTPNSILTAQIMMPNMDSMYYTDSVFMQDQSILKLLLEDYGPFARQNPKTEYSQETGMSTDMSSSSMSNHGADLRPYDYHQQCPINSTVPVDLDCLWNY